MVATYKKYNLQNLGCRDEKMTQEKLGVNYTPFGVVQEGRMWEGTVNSTPVSAYRYGFQGYEKDNEVKGTGSSYTTEFRQYDSRLGRWLTVDPLNYLFASISPYAAMDNNPITFLDFKGDSTTYVNEKGEIIYTIDDDNFETFVIDEGNEYNLYEDLKQNVKDGKIFDAAENTRLGEKYGKNIEEMEYESTGDVTYDAMAKQGYKCGYFNLGCLTPNPSLIYNNETGNSELGVVYNMEKANGARDREEGKMNRYFPVIDNETNFIRIVKNSEDMLGVKIIMEDGSYTGSTGLLDSSFVDKEVDRKFRLFVYIYKKQNKKYD